MIVKIFGLGYVGCVSAACFAREGHRVIGIDVDQTKRDLLQAGKSPIVEPGLEELVSEGIENGRFSVSDDPNIPADVSIVCVGTPSNDNGSLKLDHIRGVAGQIGQFLKNHDDYHVVNIRSTVLPGTVEDVIVPILEEQSGKKAGEDFGICMNPEFMREGTSIKDFYAPPFTVIGAEDDRTYEKVAELYATLDAPQFRVSIKAAEMIKYACNCFHALKIVFGNEIGNICKRVGVDSHEVMEVFCEDTKLNLSPYYLKPGFAFGGSCLPKDLRAITYKARDLDVETPLLNTIMSSNQLQVDQALKLVQRNGRKRIGILGLSFKAGTDDLRESPYVELIERLIGKGYKVSIFDREVSLARIFGANKRYIEKTIPHISSLLVDSVDDVVKASDMIIIAKASDEIREAIAALPPDADLQVVDLVRISRETSTLPSYYEGICW